MDYYSTLGVNRSASAEEIKKAYKKMAMQHHPDRGGDERKFKEIEEAYRTLSDPQKKQMLDMGMDPNRSQSYRQDSPFEFHFDGSPDFDQMFGRFGFGPTFGRRPPRRNKTLNIVLDITLEDVLEGKEVNAEITLPGTNKKKMVNISIPPGIESGQQIRYEGMGDAAFQDARPGDLIVNINVLPHNVFIRDGNNLIIEKRILVWDAIVGCDLNIETLDKKQLSITVPRGTQPETVLSCRHEGLPSLRNRQKGNLLIKIKIDIPKNLDNAVIEKIKEIKNNQ